MQKRIQAAADLVARAGHVVVFTGAGVSQESGIPTFRDAEEGLWSQYDPEELASVRGFMRNPALVWQWYQERLARYSHVAPNPAHHAIAELERLVPRVVVITQNIDDLHRKAGSTDIVELHGNINRYKCITDTHYFSFEEIRNLPGTPPRCPHCNQLIRPDVVWFGEYLPLDAMARAFEESRRCDVMLVVGTSALVQPAASLPYEAHAHGATIIEVNPHPSPVAEIAEVVLPAAAGQVLPQVVQRLQNRS